MDDWRKLGISNSVYGTELGFNLSLGDLHCGTTFEAKVELPDYIEKEILKAMREHKAYPVFRLMVEKSDK